MTTTTQLLTKEGLPLKESIRRAEQSRRMRAILLVAPLFLFLCISFIFPMGEMLSRSVDNTQIPQTLPRTIKALENWDRSGVPSDQVFYAVYQDLIQAKEDRTFGKLASQLNYEYSGARSLIGKTTTRIKKIDPDKPIREQFIRINHDWGDLALWRVIARNSNSISSKYYLSAVDLEYDENDKIVAQDQSTAIHNKFFIRTIVLSGLITLFCALLGFPIAYLLANLPLRHSNLLMILVLLPFWTSLLVRTSTWIVILQTNGVLNDILVWLGIVDDDNRIQMIYNTTGTLVAMTHILLPFMVLPLYSVMKTIPKHYTNAARSLGANSFTAFRKVYFPLTLSGLGAGVVLVYILSVGYYITPALVGGQKGQFITNMIAYHMSVSLNWGLAAALSTILLALVIVFYLVFNRMVGIDKIKLG